MNAFSKIDMSEVTRLTQAGKLRRGDGAASRSHSTSSIARGSLGSDVPRLTQGIKAPVATVANDRHGRPSAPGGAWTAPHSIQAAGCPASPLRSDKAVGPP